MKIGLNKDFITEEIHKGKEIKTNKVYIDTDGNEHPIYRKMVEIVWSNENAIIIGEIAYKYYDGFEDINRITSHSFTYKTTVNFYYMVDNNPSILLSQTKQLMIGFSTSVINYCNNALCELTLEYTKTTD